MLLVYNSQVFVLITKIRKNLPLPPNPLNMKKGVLQIVVAWFGKFLLFFHNLYFLCYSNEFLNLHGRICLQFSILWGIAGGIFIQFIYKPMQKLIQKVRNKVSNKAINIVIIFLTIGVSIDFVLSVLKYLK